MAIGDIYSVQFEFDNDGIACLNVFNYKHLSGADSVPANALAVALEAVIWTEIKQVMADTCILRAIEAVNIMNPADFWRISAIDDTGAIAVTPSSMGATFDAWSIRFEKAFPSAPAGHKRFPGVSETITSRNLYAPTQSRIDAILAAVLANLSDVLFNSVFSPVIVKRPFSFAVPPTVWYDIIAATWTNLTTQNSRKS